MIANESSTAAELQLLAATRDAGRVWIGDDDSFDSIVGRGEFGGGDVGMAVVAMGKLVGVPLEEVLPTVGMAEGAGAVVTGATGLLVSGGVMGAPLLAVGMAVSTGAVVMGVTGSLVRGDAGAPLLVLEVGLAVFTGAVVTGPTGLLVRGDAGAPLVLTVGIAVLAGATVIGPTGAVVSGDAVAGLGEGIRNDGTAIGLNVVTGA